MRISPGIGSNMVMPRNDGNRRSRPYTSISFLALGFLVGSSFSLTRFGRPTKTISLMTTANADGCKEPQQPPVVTSDSKQLLDLANAPSGDRSVDGVLIDLYYRIHLEGALKDKIRPMEDTNHESVMKDFHGINIWEDPKLLPTLEFLGIGDETPVAGSPIKDWKRLEQWVQQNKPRVLLEVGVFRGTTSVGIAQMLQKYTETIPDLQQSFVISVDTWLLDLRYVWPQQATHRQNYFGGNRIAGHDLMYFIFLANVWHRKVQDRIIPLQTSSLNAVLALVSRGLRADFIYLDASHANPDVFLDLIGFWMVLKPGGLLVGDDYSVSLPVQNAFDRFRTLFADEIMQMDCPGNQCWVYKKA